MVLNNGRVGEIESRMLQPLMSRVVDVPEAQFAVALFAQNMGTGRKMFGDRWYLSPNPSARLLFKCLTDLGPDKPLGLAAELCDCTEALRSTISTVLDDERLLMTRLRAAM